MEALFCVTCTIDDIYENTELMKYETYIVASTSDQAKRAALNYWRDYSWVHEVTVENTRWVHVPTGNVMYTKRVK